MRGPRPNSKCSVFYVFFFIFFRFVPVGLPTRIIIRFAHDEFIIPEKIYIIRQDIIRTYPRGSTAKLQWPEVGPGTRDVFNLYSFRPSVVCLVKIVFFFFSIPRSIQQAQRICRVRNIAGGFGIEMSPVSGIQHEARLIEYNKSMT